MAQTGLTKWLKRIFSINSLGFIVAVAGLLLAYKQLMRENGGSLTLDVNGEQSLTDIHSAYTICTGEDVIPTSSLDIFPRFTNQTKYAVKEMLLTGELRSDTTLANYIDNGWSHGYSDGVSTLRYEDTRVYPHTSVPFPFTKIEVSDDGVFDLSNRATYEGSEKPLEFSLNINFIKVPVYVGEDFDGWRARARRRLASKGDTTRPVIYFAHGRTLRLESNQVADEIAEFTRPPKSIALRSADSVAPAAVLIENLEDFNFKKVRMNGKTILDFTFKAPGQSGPVIAVIGYKYGADTVDTPWYKRLFNNSIPYSVSCWMNVSDTTTRYMVRYDYPMPNAEFLGFAKISPEVSQKVVFRNDSIFNNSDKRALILFRYPGDRPGIPEWRATVDAQSGCPMPTLELPEDEYNLVYCEIPEAEFSKRHPAAWISICAILILILVGCILIGIYATADDSDLKIWQKILIIAAVLSIAFLAGRLYIAFDGLV